MAPYNLRDAARILKVSPKRLRYWERTSLMRPRPPHGTRSVRPAEAFEFRDLVGARAVLGLIEQGISLQRIRRSVEELRERMPELPDPVAALRLWGPGSSRVVVDRDGALIEPDGQIVLDFRDGEQGEGAVADLAEARSSAEPKLSAVECFERGCEIDSEAATYEEAAELYRRAIELDPVFADAFCNLGAVLYNQGDRDGARAAFERCLEIESGHVEANFNLANMLEEDDRDVDALRHYREALRGDPLYADLHVNLALLQEKLRSPEEALEHWRRYLQLDPQGSWAEVARRRLSPS